MKTTPLWLAALCLFVHLDVGIAADRIAVDGVRTLYQTNPLFYGINALFWIDDDASRADGSYEEALDALGVTLMRYPGGTVADNFHWRETRLHSTGRFPYEDGPDKLSFDEFMAVCRAINAEPMLVVNTASWFRDGDVAGGAAEAADWVRYCMEKGYRVKYWEIGNETYHHILMGAREYAQVFITYARAMKAVDPSIQVGAVGNWNWRDVGAADRVDPAYADEIRAAEAAISRRADQAAFKDLLKQHLERNREKGEPVWWPTLMELAGPEIDFAIAHWYFGRSGVPRLDAAMRTLKTFLSEKAGRTMPVALTEWNIGGTMQKGLTRFEHDLAIGEAAFRFQDAGVDMAAYWPARMRAGNYTLISYKDNAVTDTGELFSLMTRHTLDRRLATDSAIKGVYAFATANEEGDQLRLFIFNSGKTALTHVKLDIASLTLRQLTARVMTEDQPTGAEGTITSTDRTDPILLTLPPNSITLIIGE